MTQSTDERELAMGALREIKQTIRLQRTNNPVRTRPLMSEQELMVRQVLGDCVRLGQVTEELALALTTILEQLDPFVHGYDEAQGALQNARLIVDGVRANCARLPERVRSGVGHEYKSDSASVTD
ncbi:hypothetical protein [Alicyclobacillus sp. ALC3]|uniref:hypothetical protein n=1 Tax=Alicyclobacillus sp. ALC3 TaxID=2796143 RepID=UPI0023798252|nr:hypothetical protein [Alicyclobacillus sp. ALC3]WDL99758.1 hypothetical protein JC200_23585 [Alicyclobacillus sp. ALC3]